MMGVIAPVDAQLQLSPGGGDVLRAVVEQFAPRYAPGARLLYLGDSEQRTLVPDAGRLADLGIPIAAPDKLPDVVLHDVNGRLFLVDAVTSHGPVSRERLIELEAMLTQCAAGRIYVTAVPDLGTLDKCAGDIAWGTAVWLCDEPDHLIHYDGDHYLVPRFGAGRTAGATFTPIATAPVP